jgi:MYXO-CTERM domain-containing protein
MSLARHARGRLVIGLGSLALAASLARGRVVEAAITVEDKAQESASDSPDLAIMRLTVGAGADRFLGVGVSIADANVVVATARWGNTALTRLGTAALPGGASDPCHIELWGLASPAAGVGPLRVTLTANAAFGLGAAAFAGVDATTPATGFASNSDNASPATAPARAGETVFESVCIAGAWGGGNDPDAAVASVGVGTTSLWDLTEPGIAAVGGVTAPGVAPRWTLSGRTAFAWIAGGLTLVPAGTRAADAGPVTTDGSLAADTTGLPDLAPDVAADESASAPPEAGGDAGGAVPADAAADQSGAPPDDASDDGSAPVDDAGVGQTDAPMDQGLADAGSPADDAASATDGAPEEGNDVVSQYQVGCACRLGGATRSTPVSVLALVIALGLALRRRR